MTHMRGKILRCLMVICASILSVALSVTTAYAGADDVPTIKKIYKGTVYEALQPKASGTEVILSYVVPSGKVTKIKTSNKKVLTASFESFGSERYLTVTGKKAGKAKLTYVYKGKKHKVTFVFKAWKNPVKSLKVGSKEYASELKTRNIFPALALGKRLTVVPAKGWSIKSIQYSKSGKVYDLKNKAKIPKRALSMGVVVTMVRDKDGVTEFFLMI